MRNKAVLVGRAKLLFVIALFLGPLIAAFVWYYGFGAALAPRGATNHGKLIEPLVPLTAFSNQSMTDDEVTLDALKQRWTLIYWLPAVCAEDCEKALYNTRQTRLALGRDAGRVQRIMLGAEDADAIAANHADMIFLHRGAGGIGEQVDPIFAVQGLGENDAVLIDPLGNVMMVVPLDLDPTKLLKDLKKLLKLSRVG